MKPYDSLHLEIAVSVIPLDPVGNSLVALHPWLNQLDQHLEGSLARACALLLENGWFSAAEFESKVIPGQTWE